MAFVGQEIIVERVHSWFSLVVAFTFLLLLWEISRLFAFRRQEAEVGRIEHKMGTEGVSEEQAEEEVKEEVDVFTDERKIGGLSTKEFQDLKQLAYDLEHSHELDMALMKNDESKIKELKRVLKDEKKLSTRIQTLVQDARKLVREEPTKKGAIDKALAEIEQAQNSLVKTLSRGGELEKAFESQIGPNLPLPLKKNRLRSLLAKAMHADQALLAGIKELNEVVKR